MSLESEQIVDVGASTFGLEEAAVPFRLGHRKPPGLCPNSNFFNGIRKGEGIAQENT
jgi:hypothetical protein